MNQMIAALRGVIRSPTRPATSRPATAPALSTTRKPSELPRSSSAARMICGSQVFRPYTSSRPMNEAIQTNTVLRR